MKFTINSKSFSEAICAAVDVAKNNIFADCKYQGHVTLEASKDLLTLSSFGGGAALWSQVSSTYFDQIDYSCEEAGSVTVFAKDLEMSLETLPSEKIQYEVLNNELRASLVSDPECFRSLVTFPDYVEIPGRKKDMDSQFTMNKEIFCKTLNKVAFAPAVEENLLQYQCVFLKVYGNKFQLAAGNGGRFVYNDIKMNGSGYLDCSKNMQLFIPKNNLGNIQKCLNESSAKDIVVTHYSQDEAKGFPSQLTIEFGGSILFIYNLDMYRSYPGFDNVLKHDYSNAVYSKVAEWKYAINGSAMTASSGKIHNTEVRVDKKRNRLIVESKTAHKSKTPVSVINPNDKKDKDDNRLSEGDLWFRCNTEFFKDMLRCVDTKDSDLLISFESQELLDGIKDVSEMKDKMKPVLVSYKAPNSDVKDYSEDFYMFFTVSTKD